MSSHNCIAAIHRKQTLNDWEKLGEDFCSRNSHYRCTPPSSPPDIWWSSSGSSDVDQTLPPSSSRSHHKVTTKLDFDSCIIQSPYNLHKSRARVIRNVISRSVLHNSLIDVHESTAYPVMQQLSADITQLQNTEGKDDLNNIIDAKENELKNENEVLIQNSVISQDLFESDTLNTSPVIGKRISAIHADDDDSRAKRLHRHKKRRTVKSYSEQTPSSSPVIGLRKLKVNKSFLLNSEIEEDLTQGLDLKIADLGEEQQQFHKCPLLEIGIKSPVMNCNKQGNGKKLYSSKKESSEIENGLVGSAVTAERGNDNGKQKILEISSPILGLSIEKKTKCKKRKLIKRLKDKSSNKDVKLECDFKLAKVCKNLFSKDSITTSENVNKIITSDEISHNVTCSGKLDVENDANKLACDNSNFSSDFIIESSIRADNVDSGSDKVLNEHDQSIEHCDKFNILMNSPVRESYKDCEFNISITVDSPVKETKTFFGKPDLRIAAEHSTIEDKRNNNMLNSRLEIEVFSSQEVVENYLQGTAGDKVVNVSMPVSSPSSFEVNVISSCSTPSSQKTGTFPIKQEPFEGNDSLYMDSAKKKRLRLNRSGLAARLKKLNSRKESSKHIWKHETNQMKPMRLPNKGILLTVNSIWKEYSCTLLHCTTSSSKFLSPQSSEVDDGENIENFRIVVVVESLPNFKLKPQSAIQIYPPWQIFSILHLKLTIILGVTWIEEVQEIVKGHQNLELLLKPQQVIEQTLYSFSCECLQGKDNESRCQFQFPRRGLEFLEFLLPHHVLGGISSDCVKTESNALQMDKWKWPTKEPGTIGEAVINQGCLLTGDIWLQLCVLNIFCYRNQTSSRNNEEEVCDVSWSILGCDSAGECCEVILGPAASEQNWPKVTTRQALGHFFKFTGFNLARRIHKNKNPGFWALINRFLVPCETKIEAKEKKDVSHSEWQLASMKIQDSVTQDLSQNLNKNLEESKALLHVGECQLFIYVLAPCTETWGMWPLEILKPITLPQYKIHNFSETLLKVEGDIGRYTYLAKLIWATENHLYVSDMSLIKSSTENYVRIFITPSCFLPSEIISKKSDVVLLQDLLFQNRVFSADKYSRLVAVSDVKEREDVERCPQISNEDVGFLRTWQITFPYFTPSSVTNDLVLFKGTVISVDEDSAFTWPICEICDNELLLEVSCGQYLCERCDSSKTYNRMCLEVFVQCQEILDTYRIKLKLQQDSIVNLLPQSQDNNEGYELSSVLGQNVGPLLCIVVKTAANSFFLNEIAK